jgi:hypothetical protein
MPAPNFFLKALAIEDGINKQIPDTYGLEVGSAVFASNASDSTDDAAKLWISHAKQETRFQGAITVVGDGPTGGNQGLAIDAGGLTVTAGGATVTAGGLTVSAGGAAITGNSSVTGTLGVSDKLTVSSGGADVTGDTSFEGVLTVGALNSTDKNLVVNGSSDITEVLKVLGTSIVADTAFALEVGASAGPRNAKIWGDLEINGDLKVIGTGVNTLVSTTTFVEESEFAGPVTFNGDTTFNGGTNTFGNGVADTFSYAAGVISFGTPTHDAADASLTAGAHVDSDIVLAPTLSNGDLVGQYRIKYVANPASGTDAANKGYVDAQITELGGSLAASGNAGEVQFKDPTTGQFQANANFLWDAVNNNLLTVTGKVDAVDLDASGTLVVGATGVVGSTTTLFGNLSHSEGTFSLAANNGSSITTSNGALTLTGAGNSTWSTGAGANLIVDGNNNLTLKSTAGAVDITAASASTWSSSAGAIDITAADASTWKTASNGLTVEAATDLNLQSLSTGTGAVNITAHGASAWQVAATKTGAINITARGANSDAANSTWQVIDDKLTIDGDDKLTLKSTAGAVDISAAAASAWSTSVGAIDITAAAASDWKTTAGVLTVEGNEGLALQTSSLGIGGVDITAHGDSVWQVGVGKQGKVDITARGAASTWQVIDSTLVIDGDNGLTLKSSADAVDITANGDSTWQSTGVINITANGSSTWEALGATSTLDINSGSTLTISSGADASITAATGNLTVNAVEVTGSIDLQIGSISKLVIGNTLATLKQGVTLTTETTANIDLPNRALDEATFGAGAASRFKIEGTSVSENVTAPNLDTLTAGPASKANALHSHTQLIYNENVNYSGAPANGDVLYIDSADTFAGAISNSSAAADIKKARVVGVKSSAGVIFAGVIDDVNFETIDVDGGATALAPGQAVYVSASNAGKLTNVAPETEGHIAAEVGIVLNVAAADGAYLGGTYGGTAAATVFFQVKPIVLL